eukprot:scaffold996_cov409-Prasinococcus_capsulatus_cf.AAC.34
MRSEGGLCSLFAMGSQPTMKGYNFGKKSGGTRPGVARETAPQGTHLPRPHRPRATRFVSGKGLRRGAPLYVPMSRLASHTTARPALVPHTSKCSPSTLLLIVDACANVCQVGPNPGQLSTKRGKLKRFCFTFTVGGLLLFGRGGSATPLRGQLLARQALPRRDPALKRHAAGSCGTT